MLGIDANRKTMHGCSAIKSIALFSRILSYLVGTRAPLNAPIFIVRAFLIARAVAS